MSPIDELRMDAVRHLVITVTTNDRIVVGQDFNAQITIKNDSSFLKFIHTAVTLQSPPKYGELKPPFPEFPREFSPGQSVTRSCKVYVRSADVKTTEIDTDVPYLPPPDPPTYLHQHQPAEYLKVIVWTDVDPATLLHALGEDKVFTGTAVPERWTSHSSDPSRQSLAPAVAAG